MTNEKIEKILSVPIQVEKAPPERCTFNHPVVEMEPDGDVDGNDPIWWRCPGCKSATKTHTPKSRHESCEYLRERLRDDPGMARFFDFDCKYCGAPLLNTQDPGSVLCSNPPQENYMCAVCGDFGTTASGLDPDAKFFRY